MPSQPLAESLSMVSLAQVDVADVWVLHVALAVDVDVLVLSCQCRRSRSNGQVAENAVLLVGACDVKRSRRCVLVFYSQTSPTHVSPTIFLTRLKYVHCCRLSKIQ